MSFATIYNGDGYVCTSYRGTDYNASVPFSYVAKTYVTARNIGTRVNTTLLKVVE